MADSTVTRIEATGVSIQGLGPYTPRQPGGGRPRPRRPLSLSARILGSLFPGEDTEHLEVAYESVDGQFAGIIVRDRRNGGTVATLTPEQLTLRASSAGSIFEGRG